MYQNAFSISSKSTESKMIDEDGMTPEEIGFATGVFRSIARERYFEPVYKVNKEAFDFPPELVDNLQFKKLFLSAWHHWEISIRPSMTGFFIVRLTWHYAQPRSFLEIARETHRLQSPFDVLSALKWREKIRREYRDDPERLKRSEGSISSLLKWLGIEEDEIPQDAPIYYPVHWRLAMEVINRFISVLFPKGSHPSKEHPEGISLEPGNVGPWIPLHDIYILHHFNRLYVASSVLNKSGASAGTMQQVSAQVVRTSKVVRNHLANLLEGSLLRPLDQNKPGSSNEMPYEFPSPRWKLADGLLESNLATWSDEFCILAPRLGIIIPSQKYEEYELGVSTLPKPTLKVAYSRYWEAIERMVEFVFEIRVLAQLLESDSYRLLQEMANKLEEVREDMYRGNVKVDQTLRDHAIRAAHLMRLSALVQSLSHPFFWIRAEYAARKAQFLIEELDMPRILEHIQHNIEKVSDLASHVDEIYIADLAEQNNRRATFLSVVLAAASLALVLLVLPSFFQDLTQFCASAACLSYLYLGLLSIGVITALFEVGFSLWLLYRAVRSPTYRIRSIVDELFH